METFKDLIFKKYPISKEAEKFPLSIREKYLNAKQAVMDFPNGYGISVLQLETLNFNNMQNDEQKSN